MVIWIPSDCGEWERKGSYSPGTKLVVPGYQPMDMNDGAEF